MPCFFSFHPIVFSSISSILLLQFQNGSCRTNDLKYELTTTGVKASYQNENDVLCEYPSVIIPGVPGRYKALQFHIHTSSEHTIDNQFFGAELHTVHVNEAGDRFAVVGMMIEPTADQPNSLFERLLEGWQVEYDSAEEACRDAAPVFSVTNTTTTTTSSTEPATRNLRVDKQDVNVDNKNTNRELLHTDAPQLVAPYLLIPDGATFYHYDGGLTTPPCSQVVWWNLADKPVPITPGQYNRLAEYVLGYTNPDDCSILGTYAGPAGSTSRPSVPLNGRVVDRICPVGFAPKDCVE
jgi:carbonic anhydrase